LFQVTRAENNPLLQAIPPLFAKIIGKVVEVGLKTGC